MIENDFFSYLKADSTLDTLLGSTASDSKIYPNLPKKEPTAPYIVYGWGLGDSTDELTSEDRVQVTITGSTKVSINAIRERLLVMLDLQDLIQDTTFTSTDYYIYWSKLTGGDSLYNVDRELFYNVLFFSIKYKKKV